jgi:hypothetical protein
MILKKRRKRTWIHLMKEMKIDNSMKNNMKIKSNLMKVIMKMPIVKIMMKLLKIRALFKDNSII